MDHLSLNGIKMHVASTGESGEVNNDTIFEFTEDGPVVSARYAGGNIRLGYLVGIRTGARLSFAMRNWTTMAVSTEDIRRASSSTLRTGGFT